MIRALFFDIDGTLLGPDGHISPRTRAALLSCKASGIRIFGATGRPPRLGTMLRFDAEEREIVADGGVFNNGACLELEGQRTYVLLPDQVVRRFLSAALEDPEHTVWVQMADGRVSSRFGFSDQDRVVWGLDLQDVLPFEPETFHRVISVGIGLPAARLEDVAARVRRAVGDAMTLYLHVWGAIEGTDRQANKMLGVRRVLDRYGWADDEIAVFGDHVNDVEMLREFPHSFAMDNAPDEVKTLARHVAGHHMEEGIFHALRDVLGLV